MEKQLQERILKLQGNAFARKKDLLKDAAVKCGDFCNANIMPDVTTLMELQSLIKDLQEIAREAERVDAAYDLLRDIDEDIYVLGAKEQA